MSNPATLPTESLVRFRCMVQDSNLGPEIYLKLHEVSNTTTGEKKIQCTKYCDADVSAIVCYLSLSVPECARTNST